MGFNEEAEGLEEMMELLMQDEDLDEVSEKPEVESGDELRAKVRDVLTTPLTEALKTPEGLFKKANDTRKKTKTKSLEVPRGSIKRVSDNEPKVDTRSLEAIWDAEREKLLELVHKRNQEHGVKF